MVPEYPKIDTLFERGEDFKVDPANLVIRRSEFGIPERWLVTEKVDGTNVRVSLEKNEHRLSCSYVEDECGCNLDWVVRFYGRTAAAQMPTFLLDHLQRTFTLERMKSLWRGKSNCERCNGTGREDSGQPQILSELASPFPYACDCVEPYPIVLYGEGYGAKIQKGGGDYRRGADVSLRLFDALIGETWLRRADVEDVARQLGVDPVPLIAPEEAFGPLFKVDGPWPLWTTHQVVDFVRRGFASMVALVEGTPGSQAEGVVAFTDPPLFNSRGQRLMWKLKTADFQHG